MATLNEYASKVVSILGRQSDHGLRERIKDGFKAIFATRIRQSISKNGIDDLLVLTSELPIILDPTTNIHGFKVYKTSSIVPVPIRFQNDTPFTFVGLVEGIPFSNRSYTEIRMSSKVDVKGFSKYYNYTNGVVRFFLRKSYNGLELNSNPTKAIFKTIFESPEEVLSKYVDTDSSDIQLPFPNDMLESVMLELLKTEFNYIPTDTEIKS